MYCPARTYCRSFSKAVSGDNRGDDDACACGEGDSLFDRVCGEPPQAARRKAKTRIRTVLFRLAEALVNLLISNVHDRALRIFINDIKPTAQSRIFKKVVMGIIGKYIARAKSIAY